uniref:Cytochrome P450 n=1 Tax=Heliothis virescens TaxID=7102 RepID=A0A2A4IV96_HELVI
MLSLILIFCVLCLVLLKFKRNKNKYELPPILPESKSVIGHMWFFIKNCTNLFYILTTWGRKVDTKGGVAHFYFGNELYYFITDPQDALTATNGCLKRHYGFDLIKPWLGDGLVTSPVDIWKRHRKLLNPAFSLPVIHGFLGIFNSQSRKLLEAMEPHAGKGLFDHRIYFNKNAMETLCLGVFGIDAINDVNTIQNYMEAVLEMIKLTFSKTIRVWLQVEFIYKILGYRKKEDELLETLKSMSNRVLQEKRAAQKNGSKNNVSETGLTYKPFLDLIMDLSQNGELSDKEIREETDTIIATGSETTSNQLSFTMLLLGAHPEVQEKLYQEILEVLGKDRDIEKEDLNKLVYTNAVLMESLRLLPTVPCLFRTVDKDVKLRNCTMPAGRYCLTFPLTHNDANWGPESDKFKPERWLNGDVKHNQEFAAFGLGRRSCIGKGYAVIGMKVVLAHFIRRYRIQADMSKLRVQFDFVLKPISGHEISIERRT